MPTFDEKSVVWDADPLRRHLAQNIVAALRSAIPLQPDIRLLDVGCGTGLISLPLAKDVASVLGVDLSSGMVERFTAKALSAGLTTVRGEVRDLVATPLPAQSVDLVVSAMAFHHIPDTTAMLTSLFATLAPGAWIAIADLESEDGSFHDEPVPHHGFDPALFAQLLLEIGYTAVHSQRVCCMERPKLGRSFPIFLVVGRKSDNVYWD